MEAFKDERWMPLRGLRGVVINDYEFSNYGRVKFRGELRIDMSSRKKATFKVSPSLPDVDTELFLPHKAAYVASFIYTGKQFTREDMRKVRYTEMPVYGSNLDEIVDYSELEKDSFNFSQWVNGKCSLDIR